MKNLHINEAERAILRSIFIGDYKIIAYGSRVKGTHKKFSDLDLCLKSNNHPVPEQTMAELKAQCEESNLPYKIDITDYYYLTPEFRKIVDTTGIQITL